MMHLRSKRGAAWVPVCIILLLLPGACAAPEAYRKEADSRALQLIEETRAERLGKKAAFSLERPSDLLRRRLIASQVLPIADEATLGIDKLKRIDHWPEKDYPMQEDMQPPGLPPEIT